MEGLHKEHVPSKNWGFADIFGDEMNQ